MASSSVFSDEPIYTIKTVAAQTGLLPVTVRAWEARYQVVQPHRSSNRYRLYSEKDIAILRWLKKRTEEGVSISSAVAELRKKTGSGDWPDLVRSAPGGQAVKGSLTVAPFVQRMYKALVSRDERGADALFQGILAAFDLETALVEIFTPCLHQIGDAWYHGEVGVATEHFASTYLRGKLAGLLQTYPGERGAPRILVGTGPEDHHEIGALMFAVLLRSQGYQVEYLGPDIPLEDLIEYARLENPDMIVLTATLPEPAEKLARMQGLLSRLSNVPVFGFGGQAFDDQPALRARTGGEFLGETISAALVRVRELSPL